MTTGNTITFESPLNAQFATVIRVDLFEHPFQIYCKLQEAPFAPVQEVDVYLAAHAGWVSAKQLMEALRAIATAIEKELT